MMINNPCAGLDRQCSPWDTHRLWSLWDMINFSLASFCEALDRLRIDMVSCTMSSKRADGPSFITGAHKAQFQNHFQSIARQCAELMLDKADGRIVRMEPMFEYECTYVALARELKVLSEAIEDDIRQEHFYHYPKLSGLMLLAVQRDWITAIAAFKDVGPEAEAATDCYAFGRHDACVFHLMRILEHGLRALAVDVGRTFDLQQWQNIIDEIESSISDEAKKLPRGAAKNERLEFLSQAAREFFYFKEGWRNHVAHNRTKYDAPQALSVLTHVRDFMNHLATRLSG